MRSHISIGLLDRRLDEGAFLSPQLDLVSPYGLIFSEILRQVSNQCMSGQYGFFVHICPEYLQPPPFRAMVSLGSFLAGK